MYVLHTYMPTCVPHRLRGLLGVGRVASPAQAGGSLGSLALLVLPIFSPAATPSFLVDRPAPSRPSAQLPNCPVPIFFRRRVRGAENKGVGRGAIRLALFDHGLGHGQEPSARYYEAKDKGCWATRRARGFAKDRRVPCVAAFMATSCSGGGRK